MKSDVIEAAKALSAEYDVMSNIYRTMITAFLRKKGEANWTDIKQFIEEYLGSVNPNTLHFHLKALIEANMIQRKGSEDRMTYSISEIPEYIAESIDSKILKKMK
ncbi:MAG TPA: hypothetical protein VHA09_03935 [Nitrososphaera sp.]|nr:hypothetical protein [Nitrososphaera sp.]